MKKSVKLKKCGNSRAVVIFRKCWKNKRRSAIYRVAIDSNEDKQTITIKKVEGWI